MYDFTPASARRVQDVGTGKMAGRTPLSFRICDLPPSTPLHEEIRNVVVLLQQSNTALLSYEAPLAPSWLRDT